MRQTSFRYSLSKEIEPLLIRILGTTLEDRYALRTFSREAGAGFHDSHFGMVPFRFSRAPLDEVEVARRECRNSGLYETPLNATGRRIGGSGNEWIIRRYLDDSACPDAYATRFQNDQLVIEIDGGRSVEKSCQDRHDLTRRKIIWNIHHKDSRIFAWWVIPYVSEVSIARHNHHLI